MRLAHTIWVSIHDASTRLNLWEVRTRLLRKVGTRLGLWEVDSRLSLWGVNDVCLGRTPAPETGPHDEDHDNEKED